MQIQSDIHYARSNNTRIAYQVIGSGKKTLILINGWVSNLEEGWHLPGVSEWLTSLARFTKLIVFDKRGVGLSDRVPDDALPGLEERMDDLRAIMDQEQIDRATLLGFSEGGPMALQFSATFPERVESLILYGSYACWKQQDDYPAGLPLYLHEVTLQAIDQNWGQAIGLPLMAPSVAHEPLYQKTWASFLRKSASPGAARSLYQMNLSIDVRKVLPNIQVPTLILHREADKLIPLRLGQYLAEHIPGATLITFPGTDHFPWIGDNQAIIQAIGDFMGESNLTPTHTAAFGTLAAIQISADFPEKYLISQLQQANCIFSKVSKEVWMVVFESPEQALTILQAMFADQNLHTLPTIAVHTGVYSRHGEKVEGPAICLLLQVLPLLEPGYIWLTQAARNLLSNLYFEYALIHEMNLPEFPASIWMYACRFSGNSKPDYQAVLQEGKLREHDIAILLNVRKYLEENYLTELSISTISREFAINTFKLKYGFKALFDMAVMQFVQDLRLEHARQLLLHSQQSISDIADLVGYQQPGNFSKAFTKKYGNNPADFRKKEPKLQPRT